MLLATLLQLAIATAVALIFSASLFYTAYMWTESVVRAGFAGHTLRFFNQLFHAAYLTLPIISVADDQTQPIRDSLHVPQGSWKYLAYSAANAIALSAFCYFTALFSLQRKKHI
jgi:hypothetical protein